jgi:Transglutaminase-like superfamily
MFCSTSTSLALPIRPMPLLCRLAALSVLLGVGFDSSLVSAQDAKSIQRVTDISPEKDNEETWQVLYLSGQKIGHAHTVIATIIRDGKKIVQTATETDMVFKRFGQKLVMKQSVITEETPDGSLLSFRSQMDNPPATSTSTVGKVVGKELHLDQTVNRKKSSSVQEWRPDVKSPTFQDRVLKQSPLKPGESRSFEAFLPDFGKVSTINLTAGDWEEVKLLDGSKQKLLSVKLTQAILPGFVLTGYVDESGETLKTTTSLLGAELVMYQVTKDEALRSINGAQLDLAISTLIKVPRIPNAHGTKRVVYRVTTSGHDDPTTVLPAGQTQLVKRTGPEKAELTVSAEPIPSDADAEKGASSAIDKQFMASTQFLQRDDELVQEHAEKAVGGETNPSQIARRMEQYVYKNLHKKNFSTAMASAGEVAKSLEGDCSEHAVLLAAMLRAKKVPSRVVVGLVYVELNNVPVFGGHMWTEAYLGQKWVPLDATLGRGGIGAAHIKLSDSSLSEGGTAAMSSFASQMLVIGQLKLDVASAE